MKELLIKFESEKDYKRFIDIIITPGLGKDTEFDEINDIVIIKQVKEENEH